MSNMRLPPLEDKRRVVRACAVAGLLSIVIGLALAGMLVSSYHGTIEREQTNLRNLATALAARTRYATLAMDMALARDAERALRGEDGTISALAGAVREDMPFRVYVLGDDGQLMAKHPLRAPEKPLPHPGHALVGIPQIGFGAPDRPGGVPTITLARTLPKGEGRTGGSIVIETDAAYFQHILESADLGDKGRISLIRLDGMILMLKPSIPNMTGRFVSTSAVFQTYMHGGPTGNMEGPSPIDGVDRLYGYATVKDYPLMIVVTRDKADALSLWDGWLGAAVLGWLLHFVTMMLLALRIGRESSRQAVLIDRLTMSEGRLTHSYGYLMRIVDTLATPLWVLDAQRRIVLFNKAFRRFTGRAEADALAGRGEAEVLDPAGAPARARLYASVADDGVHVLEAGVRGGLGEARTVIQMAARLESEDQAPQIVNSFTDITERKRAESRLAYLSDYDTLTGLPNNHQLRRVLGEAVRAAATRGEHLALLLVTLERLQEVADLLGQEAGDEAVIQVAARLRTLDGTPLCTARVKANEFGLVVPIASVMAALGTIDGFAFELHQMLSEPVRVQAREFHLEPVIGIALYPQDTGVVNELMRLADIAKHRARGEGGDPVHFHSASTHVQLNERLSLEEKLRRALERGELAPVYQPKVEIASGRVVGVEALLRWTNPELGSVPPTRFIPIAEQTGLIVPIGNWVLRTACMHANAWRREHGIGTRVAVNLSIRQFYQRDLLRSIADALADSGLPPACLELEITESIAMSRIDVVERLLAGIRDLGVELSIDDFGTGYSSLAYLKRFPVQCLKVDRAFVRDLGRDADSAAIVRSIVALGHGLQMRIVAEGVETEGQLALLRELGCDEFQGFLFARPVDAAAVPGLLGAANLDIRHG